MYKQQELECGFIIICTDENVGLMKSTASSIRANYAGPIICVVPEDSQAAGLDNIKHVCPIYKGGKTVTSLINKGMRESDNMWNMIVIGGNWMRPNLDRKYSYFIEDEKDILFPVVNRQFNFVDGTLNGMMVHKSTFDKIGDFDEENPLEICKLFWAMKAKSKGCKFKAVVGARIS